MNPNMHWHHTSLDDAWERFEDSARYARGRLANFFGPVQAGLALHVGSATPAAQRPLQLQCSRSWFFRLAWQGQPLFWSFCENSLWGAYLLRDDASVFNAVQPIGHWSADEVNQVAALPPEARPMAWLRHLVARLQAAPQGCFLQMGEWHLVYSGARPLTDLSEADRDFAQRVLPVAPWGKADWHDRITALKNVNPHSARLKYWRKVAAAQALPPLSLWELTPIHSHVILDGHERLRAALDAGFLPPTIRIYRVQAHPSKTDPQQQAALLWQSEKMKQAVASQPWRLSAESADGMNQAIQRAFDDRPWLQYSSLGRADLASDDWLLEVCSFALQRGFGDELMDALMHDRM